MRVLHVITGLSSGGAEQQLRLLLRQHRANRGPTNEVVALTNPGVVADGLRADGTVVHELGMRGNRDVAALPRLVKLLHRGGYDLVHTHLYRACVYGRAGARIAGVPAVATEHSLGDFGIEGRRTGPAVRGLYLATERMGRLTFAVSREVADRLVAWGVPPQRVRYLPNGIDARGMGFQPESRQKVRAELGIPPEAFVAGTVGRLVSTKRLDVAVRAVAELAEAWLVVVGDGGERAKLTEVVRRSGTAGRVVFAGESGDIAGHLSAMDVLVSPSPAETFGLAVLEGLASGLPVLYSSAPALQELPPWAAPGARLVPSDPAAYREALRDRQASAPRRLAPPPAVAHYDIVRLAAQVESAYRAVLEAGAYIGRSGRGEGRWREHVW